MNTSGWRARRIFEWREYWARRSRLRAATVLLALLAAVVVGALALAPSGWLGVAQGWLRALGAAMSALPPHSVVIGVIVALVLLAILLSLTAPLPRAYRRNAEFAGQAPAQASATARVLVYLDAENQPSLDFNDAPVSADMTLKYMIEKLRIALNGQRADLLFYMDSSIPQYRSRREELYRYGFRLVDVPHRPFQMGGEKPSMVDMEMALQTYQRALTSLHPQIIILITADQDYIPLVYRLWADGHHVEVWGDFLPEAYRELQKYLAPEQLGLPSTDQARRTRLTRKSVQTVEYDPQSPGDNPWVAAALTDDTLLAVPALAQVAGWITETLAILQAVYDDAKITPETKLQSLTDRLAAPTALRWLRQGNRHLSAEWLHQLQTAGVLVDATMAGKPRATGAPANATWRQDAPGYAVGSVGAEPAAERIGRLISRVARVAQGMARQKVRSEITLERLCKVTLLRPLPGDLYTISRTLSLSKERSDTHLSHARLLCVCARELGLLAFEPQALTQEIRQIQVTPASE